MNDTTSSDNFEEQLQKTRLSLDDVGHIAKFTNPTTLIEFTILSIDHRNEALCRSFKRFDPDSLKIQANRLAYSVIFDTIDFEEVGHVIKKYIQNPAVSLDARIEGWTGIAIWRSRLGDREGYEDALKHLIYGIGENKFILYGKLAQIEIALDDREKFEMLERQIFPSPDNIEDALNEILSEESLRDIFSRVPRKEAVSIFVSLVIHSEHGADYLDALIKIAIEGNHDAFLILLSLLEIKEIREYAMPGTNQDVSTVDMTNRVSQQSVLEAMLTWLKKHTNYLGPDDLLIKVASIAKHLKPAELAKFAKQLNIKVHKRPTKPTSSELLLYSTVLIILDEAHHLFIESLLHQGQLRSEALDDLKDQLDHEDSLPRLRTIFQLIVDAKPHLTNDEFDDFYPHLVDLMIKHFFYWVDRSSRLETMFLVLNSEDRERVINQVAGEVENRFYEMETENVFVDDNRSLELLGHKYRKIFKHFTMRERNKFKEKLLHQLNNDNPAIRRTASAIMGALLLNMGVNERNRFLQSLQIKEIFIKRPLAFNFTGDREEVVLLGYVASDLNPREVRIVSQAWLNHFVNWHGPYLSDALQSLRKLVSKLEPEDRRSFADELLRRLNERGVEINSTEVIAYTKISRYFPPEQREQLLELLTTWAKHHLENNVLSFPDELVKESIYGRADEIISMFSLPDLWDADRPKTYFGLPVTMLVRH